MYRGKTYVPRTGYLSMNPFELHKHLINTYVLTHKGATALLQRDASRDKTDEDIMRENHRFLWEDDDEPITWEEKLAKKYYDKLYKEFGIADLSRYKENKVAMRWQTEKELVTGKGQFICGNKLCTVADNLKTWEINFAYSEHGEKKNALVKIRLCADCSKKLNYRQKRKELKRLKNENNKMPNVKTVPSATIEIDKNHFSKDAVQVESQKQEEDHLGEDIWKAPLEELEGSSRDEEFEKYLEHLLL